MQESDLMTLEAFWWLSAQIAEGFSVSISRMMAPGMVQLTIVGPDRRVQSFFGGDGLDTALWSAYENFNGASDKSGIFSIPGKFSFDMKDVVSAFFDEETGTINVTWKDSIKKERTTYPGTKSDFAMLRTALGRKPPRAV
jgi:hypothetical protein